MLAKDLANLLRQLTGSRLSLQPSEERDDLIQLIEALDRNETRSITDLVRALNKAWPLPKTAKRKPAAPGVDPVAFFRRLDAARDQPAEFDNLLAELATSKSMKTADVAAIANRFRGSSKRYKSRSAAVEDIRKTWFEDRRDVEKVAHIREIF